jgi:GT2 family glycosyltransferase
MKVSILIHNLNRASALKRCLLSVLEQTYRPLEVVLLDAGSTDGSHDVIRRIAKTMEQAGMEVKSINCPPMGVAASRNFGASQSSGDLICAIDNDASFVFADSIERVVHLFCVNSLLAVASFQILRADETELDPYAWVFRRPAKVWADRQFKTFTFAGAGSCFKSDTFWEVGGFWNHLRYSREEEDLGLALLDKGFELVYAPQVVVRHYFDSTGRSSMLQRRQLELKNGILIFWRRLPIPLGLLAIGGRILTMSIRMLVKERTFPLDLLRAVPAAAQEWRRFKLKREPVSYRATWKYISLHFA